MFQVGSCGGMRVRGKGGEGGTKALIKRNFFFFYFKGGLGIEGKEKKGIKSGCRINTCRHLLLENRRYYYYRYTF